MREGILDESMPVLLMWFRKLSIFEFAFKEEDSLVVSRLGDVVKATLKSKEFLLPY
jgi:hypothetical protein